MKKRNEELERWKDAVWDYMLEHSDITESGVLFVKFHTKNRRTFEGHVSARYSGKYHRGDPREREEELYVTQVVHKTAKQIKKDQKKEEKALRIAKQDEIKKELARVKRSNERRALLKKVWTFVITPFKKMMHL